MTYLNLYTLPYYLPTQNIIFGNNPNKKGIILINQTVRYPPIKMNN